VTRAGLDAHVIVDLSAPFQQALDSVLGRLGARADLVGILFFGSAARGDARAGSDLDLYAITAHEAHGHLGDVIGDVPVEVSFGSLAQMAEQVRQERPAVVHAFATGRLLLDHTDGALALLCREARSLWERGPSPLAPSAALRFRFHLTDLVRDLETMPERSAATALVGSRCVQHALEALCAAECVWMSSMRDVLGVLDSRYPDVTAIVRRCADSGFPASFAVEVADRVLSRFGGRLSSYDTSGT